MLFIRGIRTRVSRRIKLGSEQSQIKSIIAVKKGLFYKSCDVTLNTDLTELRNTCLEHLYIRNIKVKGKGHPITGHEGPEEGRGIALLFL